MWRRRFQAGNGEPGRSALKHGASGETAEIRVPVGTQVFDEDEQLIADLASPNARVVVARGGIAGRGNKHFASPTRRTPTGTQWISCSSQRAAARQRRIWAWRHSHSCYVVSGTRAFSRQD